MEQTRVVNLHFTRPALADLEEVLDCIAAHWPRNVCRNGVLSSRLLNEYGLCRDLNSQRGIARRTPEGSRRCVIQSSFVSHGRWKDMAFFVCVMTHVALPHRQVRRSGHVSFETHWRGNLTNRLAVPKFVRKRDSVLIHLPPDDRLRIACTRFCRL